MLKWDVKSRVMDADDRGDVPGWVLITLMTAGLPAVPSKGHWTKRPW